ncbi:hypothetical protein F6Q07_21495 [Pectobacterium parmentieri]|uniref:hypothetical protein n=1 Tax=Pectobacterium parmentieri TaxID=1905730 RepID=UPI000CDE458A|nr:hypothetical protein [Pectobacterium parmentieri]AYH05902.1 hypothetical protein C5E25_11365 [Pectobacterium parmentieri]AYH14723.1 hypothetical protein C5E23_11335 [Pectobacterium parmentieri]AYH23424.1 hypothetical protein C5E21_11340 [Pectobacterium parmentieri]MBI0520674.1 hypothetical protein [Pectobacterium parmentieri]MBN3177919.1 hypothetical protein [Pectobacterium parmentieri]
MSFISEYIAVLLVTFALITIFASFKGLKGQKEDSIQIQQWLTRESWKGEVAQGKLKTWKQITTTNNYNHYYILTFESSFNGMPENYSAAIVLNVTEVVKLKKDFPLVVKYQGVPPKKIAVLSVEFDN